MQFDDYVMLLVVALCLLDGFSAEQRDGLECTLEFRVERRGIRPREADGAERRAIGLEHLHEAVPPTPAAKVSGIISGKCSRTTPGRARRPACPSAPRPVIGARASRARSVYRSAIAGSRQPAVATATTFGSHRAVQCSSTGTDARRSTQRGTLRRIQRCSWKRNRNSQPIMSVGPGTRDDGLGSPVRHVQSPRAGALGGDQRRFKIVTTAPAAHWLRNSSDLAGAGHSRRMPAPTRGRRQVLQGGPRNRHGVERHSGSPPPRGGLVPAPHSAEAALASLRRNPWS